MTAFPPFRKVAFRASGRRVADRGGQVARATHSSELFLLDLLALTPGTVRCAASGRAE
jgi:hypothetical protein